MKVMLARAVGLAGMMLLGGVLKRFGVFSKEDAKVISRLIIYVTLPAAIANGFRGFQLDPAFFAMIGIAVVANLSLMCLGLWLSRGKDMPTQALYSMNISSYNVGCVAMPLIQSFLPAEAVVVAAMFDAGNCPFNAGISYAVVSARGNGERVRPVDIIIKLLHSAPFMSFLVLMVMAFMKLEFPEWVYTVTGALGGANTYLAMLMIGIIFDIHVGEEERFQIFQILILRYTLNLALAVLVWFLPLPVLLRQVGVLIILSPIPSVSMVYCEKCGCKPEQYGVVNSLSLAISLCLMFPLLILFQM